MFLMQICTYEDNTRLRKITLVMEWILLGCLISLMFHYITDIPLISYLSQFWGNHIFISYRILSPFSINQTLVWLRQCLCCWFIVYCCCESFVFGTCFVMKCLVPILVLQSSRGRIEREREKAGCFTLIVFLLSCDYSCSLALPHDAVGWSAVYECGIFWSYSHTFWKRKHH